TTTTTTTPLPHPPQQSTTESELAKHVAALEKKLSDLEQTNKNLDNTTRNLGFKVYTLELRDLPYKINEAVRENVKEAFQIALQAPLQDRFRDLSEDDMKEMLHQRMFESGSYKSLPEHIALYEALEASMECAQRDEFLAEKDKSRKRRRDDQDPPPPPPDLDLNAPLSSSKQQFDPHDEQPVKDIPIPDSANISDSEDTGYVYLPHLKPRTEWLKPIPEDDRPATPEPAWVIPTSHVPDAENNWANALATTYQALAKNSLLEKTRDMQMFMNWYCQQKGKTELTQADLEDQINRTNPEGGQVRIDINRPLHLSGLPALSISKMKVARYHDFGLELLVPEHMWIDDLNQAARADHQEYTIAEKDFKNLYLIDCKDLNLLLLQGHLNYIPGSDKRFEFKHDYTIIDSPRAVVFPVSNNEWKIMRFNEIYTFSDGTLTNIMEPLDYRVKKYNVNRLNLETQDQKDLPEFGMLCWWTGSRY
ncbi:hypothetical protein Tco_1381213, partial [Tanacetum coccineum]